MEIMIETKTISEKATILVGSPNVGMIGSVVIEHISKDFQKIGYFYSKKMQPAIINKKNEVIEPIRIFYSKKYNLILIQPIFNLNQIVWEFSEDLINLSTNIKAKEIIIMDGVLVKQEKSKNVHLISKKKIKINSKLIKPLEGTIMIGIISALFLIKNKLNIIGLFAESNGQIQDDTAAAHMIEVLNEYLKTDFESESLIKNADNIRKEMHNIMEHTKSPKENLNYFI